MMNYSSIKIDELKRMLDTDFEKGLSQELCRKRRGENVLKKKRRKGFFGLLMSEFSDFMTVVLIAAAIVSYISGYLKGDADFFEPVLIMAIVIMNAVMGVIQQLRAENAIEALKKMQSKTVNVLRDGKNIAIDSKDLVPGDVVFVKAGEKISADMRIIESVQAECDESSLTGESMAVSKQAKELPGILPVQEQSNMLFSGTALTSGHAVAVVCSVGMNTEMGKIAGLIMQEEETTPLEKKLSQLGKTLGIGAIIICAVIFFIGVLKKIEPLDMFITAVSLAVAAIPEGLAAIVTVMLAIGVERMAKQNAVVKKLSAVETLGAATVICTDKTGTITQNKMKVTEVYTKSMEQLSQIARATSSPDGTPTDKAVYEKFHDGKHKWKILDENPFDSKRKMMSVLVETGDKTLCAVKGAAEIILNRSTKIAEDGKISEIGPTERGRLMNIIEQMAKKGLRVLAVAYSNEKRICENDLILCGFIGISDPPRIEAVKAVSECIKAGIKVVMVTGDHRVTAEAIAREVGIIQNNERVIDGKTLDAMNDEELSSKIDNTAVFARVTPEQKLRIVKAYKALGYVSAMTGDGVNDAPALKAADIGCSMGKNGTDVAKEASDMVLADDNFATIVAAVKEGRRILSNIKKAVLFLLSSNVGELICVLLGLVMGVAAPLTAPQLLWINLVTDSLPAIALGLDPAEKNIMTRKPEANKVLIENKDWITILTEGAMIGALALVAYTVGNVFFYKICGSEAGRTMAFVVLAISQLIHAFNLRSKNSVIGREFFKNKFLLLSFVLGVTLTVLLISNDITCELFGVCRLSFNAWVVCILFSLVPLLVVEIAKKAEAYAKRKC